MPSISPGTLPTPHPFVGNTFRTLAAMLGIAIAGLQGCALLETSDSKNANKKHQVLWPALPDQPRFKFEGILRSAADILQETGEMQLKQEVTGKSVISDKPVINKPSGIAMRNGLVYVAEPAAKAVTVFDLAHRKLFRFGQRPPNALKLPQAIALDAAGLVYVLDSIAQRVMIFDSLGLFVNAIALEKNTFSKPVAVAASPDGNTIYVVDRGDVANDDHKVVAFAPDGTERFRIGRRGQENGKFNIPLAAAVAADGTLYVVDAGNFRVQAFDANGKFKFAFGGAGAELGSFSRPRSIALDPEGNIYVADGAFNNVQIFNADGQLLMPLGNLSHEAGPGNYALIAGIAVDEANRLYVLDNYFKKIEIYSRLSDTEGKRLMVSK